MEQTVATARDAPLHIERQRAKTPSQWSVHRHHAWDYAIGAHPPWPIELRGTVTRLAPIPRESRDDVRTIALDWATGPDGTIRDVSDWAVPVWSESKCIEFTIRVHRWTTQYAQGPNSNAECESAPHRTDLYADEGSGRTILIADEGMSITIRGHDGNQRVIEGTGPEIASALHDAGLQPMRFGTITLEPWPQTRDDTAEPIN